MAKIYALHYDEQRFKMKISCAKHWERQKELLENSTDVTVRWNNCVLLSFSRSALVEKANEIKNKWLQKQYENISKIASIELRR